LVISREICEIDLIVKLCRKGWVKIPAAMRKKYGLKPGSELSVVDYGGVLTLVPLYQDLVRAGAGMLKGNTRLTDMIVEEHHQEHE
jgi:AbrB family looped-hinge helix DNA binding protein